MGFSESGERPLQSTRGKILALLRKRELTVQDLANELGLTDNGVRTHLATLERDGFIRAVSSRRSTRKPARVYALVPEAEQRLSVAYPPVLLELLEVLERTLTPEERARTMREVGARLAGERRIPASSGPIQAQAAAGVLEQLGGSCEVIEKDGHLSIHGNGCPLSVVTRTHPEACVAVEALLSTMLGCEVHERCNRGPRPRCLFETSLRAGESE